MLLIDGFKTTLCVARQTRAQNGRKTLVLETEIDGYGGRGQLIRRDLVVFIGLLT
jgi:hypothetical protein